MEKKDEHLRVNQKQDLYSTIWKFIGYSHTDFKDCFHPTIIMEFCSNETLRDAIEKENKDSHHQNRMIYGIASGMKYLHQQNSIYNDFKSQNILMDESLFLKIADFGLSKMTKISENSSCLNLQSISGLKKTPIYMAPEIMSNKECTKGGDV